MAMKGKKILITGPTGQVAYPTTLALARDNEVWGAARFSDPEKREALEKAGVHCETVDLAGGDFSLGCFACSASRAGKGLHQVGEFVTDRIIDQIPDF